MSTQDLTDAISVTLAALALVLQIVLALLLLLAVAALFAQAPRRLLRELRELLFGQEMWAAWVVALVATAGSLYFSEVAHYIPCRLCWYQRIAMYPLSVVLLLAVLRRDMRGAAIYAIPLTLVGIGVATYHMYIEAHPEAETAGCKLGGASCAVKWIDELGYITFPTLAATAFAAILALSLLTLWRVGWRTPSG